MLNLKRKIHAVGHGGFYSEIFLDDNSKNYFCAIYDCGSENRSRLNYEINKLFKEVQTIDLLFISHFDDDHVNGIIELGNTFKNHIKYVVIPYLDYDTKVYHLTRAVSVKASGVLFEFIDHPEEFLKTSCGDQVHIIYINPIDDDDIYKYKDDDSQNIEDIEYGEEYILPEDTTNAIHSLSSGTNIVGYLKNLQLKWKWVPFNYNKSKVAINIANDVKSLLKNNYHQNDIDYNWIVRNMNTIKGSINKIYKKYNTHITGDKNYSNVNSLVIYSGPNKESDICSIDVHNYNCFCRCCYLLDNKAGFLYCGDYNASDRNSLKPLQRFYNVFRKNLGGIQIPHHGSEYNFDVTLAKDIPICIVSVGVLVGAHKGQFPHDSVAKSIIKNAYLAQVTDQIWTEFWQDIYILTT